MRRWTAAAVCAGAVLLSVGCSLPPGTDGDVTNGWSRIAAPASFVPAAGTCHEELTRTAPMESYRPVDCTELHVTETVHVGTVRGGPGAADEPPADASAEARAAYRDCSDRATAFAGGPWRSGLLSIAVTWPSRPGWAGGARWYRCELTQAELTSGRLVSREGSLAKALTGAAMLKLGCFAPKISGERVTSMDPVACTAKHRAEFAGVWDAPDIAYDALAGDEVRTAKGCRTVIARYTGVPDDGNMQYRTGWISYNPTEGEWSQGERGVRCFLWFDDKQVSRSLKGAGPAALPIRYA